MGLQYNLLHIPGQIFFCNLMLIELSADKGVIGLFERHPIADGSRGQARDSDFVFTQLSH